jgi:hypothetical protein
MTHCTVQVRELAAWGFDDYAYRCPQPHGAPRQPVEPRPFEQSDIILADETARLASLLLPHSHRADLLEEMAGLHWSLGVIDLRHVLAFQRRLAFDPALPPTHIPAAHDWPSLIDLSFGPTKSPACTSIHDAATNTITLESSNPNLHLRTSSNPAAPLTLHAGGPFFEVASFRNRWLLRDGYHRAYSLLRAGIHAVPAVIVYARTLAELGATQPWFFPEDILFSSHPPRVADFLDDTLVLEYQRPPLVKTIRITIEESLTPAPQPAPLTGDPQ